MSAVATDRMLTSKEAAGLFSCKEQTLAVWRTNKRYALPYVKVGRLVRYRLSDLEAFLERRTESGGGEQE